MTEYALDSRLTGVCLTGLITVESRTYIAARRMQVRSQHTTVPVLVAGHQKLRVETSRQG
jgi:hypothetical protein